MCYAKPGPRCSSHALESFQKARDTYIDDRSEENMITLKRAVSSFFTTPRGFAVLNNAVKSAQDIGDNQNANRFESLLNKGKEKREKAKKAYKEETGKRVIDIGDRLKKLKGEEEVLASANNVEKSHSSNKKPSLTPSDAPTTDSEIKSTESLDQKEEKKISPFINNLPNSMSKERASLQKLINIHNENPGEMREETLQRFQKLAEEGHEDPLKETYARSQRELEELEYSSAFHSDSVSQDYAETEEFMREEEELEIELERVQKENEHLRKALANRS